MTSPDNSILPVRSAAEMLAAVPHLVGFHPTNSIVLIAIAGTKVALVTRGDLPAGLDDIAQALPVLDQVHATHVVIAAYGPEDLATPAVDAARAVLTVAGLQVYDALRVTDGRYWSYLCDNPTCCSPEGTLYDAVASPLSVRAVVSGSSPFVDRAGLAASIASAGGAVRAAMDEATDRARRRLADLPASLSAVEAEGQAALTEAANRYRSGQRCTDDEVAWLTTLLSTIAVRDHAWLTASREEWHLELWRDLTRRADPDLVAAPASLLAFTAWLQGNGALADIAAHRALTADPNYGMALLVLDGLRAGIPPSVLQDWQTWVAQHTDRP
ncbi:DUF4192 domain-containing protein [Micromonospora arida]